MGFYGNITNISGTQFQFDRIYSNRVAMDAGVNTDGIYVGRYVLVEYDINGRDDFIEVYKKGSEFYTSPNFEKATLIYYSQDLDNKQQSTVVQDSTGDKIYVGKNWIVYINDNLSDINNEFTSYDTYYKCINDSADDGKIARFEQLTEANATIYKKNYDIDYSKHGRNYDSTVWMKTSITQNNQLNIKYVQVAELNTVVPTFDLAVDAPSMAPITPHFGAESTNTYYKLHIQPSYGLRIAAAANDYSDETTYWTRTWYNTTTNKSEQQYWNFSTGNWEILPANGQVPEDTGYIKAAIYYNKAAFTEYVAKDENGNFKDTSEPIVRPDKDNIISIAPTGSSGMLYNQHVIGTEDKTANDIMEMRIDLHGVGNMMHKAWDLIHGENRDDNPAESLQGKMDFFTGNIANFVTGERQEDGSYPKVFAGLENNEIPIQSAINDRIIGNTLVGSKINGGKDFEFSNEEMDEFDKGDILKVSLDADNYHQDDAWIKTDINSQIDESGAEGGDYRNYHRNAISIHHTFHSATNTKSTSNLNNELGNIITLEETKTQEENLKPVHTKDTIGVYTPKVDAAGHVVGKNIETITLPYGFKNITINNPSTSTSNPSASYGTIVADNTQDTLTITPVNKWVKMSPTFNSDTINIGHKLTDIVTQANQDYGLTENKTIDQLDKENNTFKIPVFKFDEAGHIIKAETNAVTLPDNFDKITISVSDDNTLNKSIEGTIGTLQADTMTDTVTLAEGNRWINIIADVDNDQIVFKHYVNDIDTNASNNTDLNGNGDIFSVEDITIDNAGHIIAKKPHRYTLPYGFKTIKADNNAITAQNTQDTIEFKTDNWLTYNVNNRIITISHDNLNNSRNSTELKTSTQNPINFGSIINIPSLKYDTKGHIVSTNSVDIALPMPSLVSDEAGTAQVLTGLDLEASAGKFTYHSNYISNLLLTNYNLGNDKSPISSTDSLGVALSKLQNNINMINGDKEGSIKKAIADVVNGAPTAFDTLKEISDWLENTSNKDATDIISDINANTSAISINAEAIVANATAINTEIANRNSSEASLKEELTQNINDVSATSASAIEKLELADEEIINKFTNYYTQEEVENLLFELQEQINELKILIKQYHPAVEENKKETE